MAELRKFHTFGRKRVFLNPRNINKLFYCCICQDVFDDPVRTICGHVFCYICIQQWSNVKMECPMCKKSIAARKLEKDLIVSALIDELEVKCFHKDCQWIGTEALRKKHQRCCSFKPKNEQIPKTARIQNVEATDLDYCNEDKQLQIISSQKVAR